MNNQNQKEERHAWDKKAADYISQGDRYIGIIRDHPESRDILTRKLLEYCDSTSLEVGCGSGRYSLAMAKLKGISCTLLDFSPETIRASQELFKANSTNAEFVLADMACLPFSDSSFNFIHGQCSLEHVKNHKQAVSEISRCLVPGGYTIVTVPNKLRVIDGWDFYKLVNKIDYLQLSFTPGQLTRLFQEQGLEVIELFGRDLVGPFGSRFLFKSYLGVRRFVNRFRTPNMQSQKKPNGVSQPSSSLYLALHKLLGKQQRTFIAVEIGVVARK